MGKWERKKEQKYLRMLQEGLFFNIWHSDKPVYQKENAEKIAKLFTQIGEKHGVEKQK